MPVLLFTGHRLDAADRPAARFTAAMVPRARAQIAAAIAAEQAAGPVPAVVSSLAAGADLLFAEEALRIGLPLYAFLPLPEPAFLAESVVYPTAPDDPTDWLGAYRAAAARAQVYVTLARGARAGDDPFAACNRRMLVFAQHQATLHGTRVVAISYFSPQHHHAGSAGGAADFTHTLRTAGVPVRHLLPS